MQSFYNLSNLNGTHNSNHFDIAPFVQRTHLRRPIAAIDDAHEANCALIRIGVEQSIIDAVCLIKTIIIVMFASRNAP